MTDKLVEFLIKALFFVAIYLQPLYGHMVIITVFVFFDLVIAIFAAKKLGTYDQKKAWNTIPKLVFYFVALILSHMIQKEYLPDVQLLKICSAFIAYLEIKSIDQSGKTLTGYSFFQIILERLKLKK